MTNAPSLRPGDRVPDFALPGLDGKLRKFLWSFTGDPVALLAVDDLAHLDVAQFGALLAACQASCVTPVVAAGNAVAGAAGPWTKLGGSAETPLLLCDAELGKSKYECLHADYEAATHSKQANAISKNANATSTNACSANSPGSVPTSFWLSCTITGGMRRPRLADQAEPRVVSSPPLHIEVRSRGTR